MTTEVTEVLKVHDGLVLLLGVLATTAANYVKRWWSQSDHLEERTREEMGSVKVAEIEAQSQFQDRLMKQITFMSADIAALREDLSRAEAAHRDCERRHDELARKVKQLEVAFTASAA